MCLLKRGSCILCLARPFYVNETILKLPTKSEIHYHAILLIKLTNVYIQKDSLKACEKKDRECSTQIDILIHFRYATMSKTKMGSGYL